MSYVDPHFRRMQRPGRAHHGRRVTRRDKLLGTAFGAALLLGVWWLLSDRSSSFSVIDTDVYSSFGWTSRTHQEGYAGIHGVHEGRPVSVFVGTSAGCLATTEAAFSKHQELQNGDPKYPDADQKEVGNAVVVCGVPDDCKSVASRISHRAKTREDEWRAIGKLE